MSKRWGGGCFLLVGQSTVCLLGAMILCSSIAADTVAKLRCEREAFSLSCPSWWFLTFGSLSIFVRAHLRCHQEDRSSSESILLRRHTGSCRRRVWSPASATQMTCRLKCPFRFFDPGGNCRLQMETKECVTNVSRNSNGYHCKTT